MAARFTRRLLLAIEEALKATLAAWTPARDNGEPRREDYEDALREASARLDRMGRF